MWIYVSDSHDPAWNLATEELLFQGQEELCMLYINSPSVILGCNQVWENEVDLSWCKANDVQILRRISGGGAVYHDSGNLNYSFITNKKTGDDKMTGAFLEPVISTLRTMNVPAIIGKRKDLWLPAGTKISGTASHITAHRAMNHGTLLYDANLKHLENALLQKVDNKPLRGIASVPSPVKNIRTFLQENNIESPETTVFFQGFSAEISKVISFDGYVKLSDNQLVEIEKLVEKKYKTETWNFRR